MTEKLRFGIVGCGVIGPIHAEAIASLPGAQLVAVTDIVPERAQRLANKYMATLYTELQEMLAHENLDVVIICTPSGLHGEHACQVMRSGRHVLDLTDAQVATIKKMLHAQGIGIAAIGSPIGKVPIDSPFDEHLQRFERAIGLAHTFGTPFIRIFSFYPPTASTKDVVSADPSEWRNEVLRRLREMTARARAAGIILLHENEKDIYGDTIARCTDLLQSCDDVHFRAILDPANFIQCGQVPYPDAYEALRPWLRYVHVKDARPDGSVVTAGEGVAHWLDLLRHFREDGYDGFFSLEPHLAAAGQYSGFSGPDLFRQASQALQQMLQRMGWEYN